MSDYIASHIIANEWLIKEIDMEKFWTKNLKTFINHLLFANFKRLKNYCGIIKIKPKLGHSIILINPYNFFSFFMFWGSEKAQCGPLFFSATHLVLFSLSLSLVFSGEEDPNRSVEKVWWRCSFSAHYLPLSLWCWFFDFYFSFWSPFLILLGEIAIRFDWFLSFSPFGFGFRDLEFSERCRVRWTRRGIRSLLLRCWRRRRSI